MGRLNRFELVDLRPGAAQLNLARDAWEGLSALPKHLPPVYFYDDAGSRLFEEITRTPEYYVTRTELSILRAYAGEMLEDGGGPLMLVELGSGSSLKTRPFIELLLARQGWLQYIPIDVSPAALRDASRALLETYPRLSVTACAASYEAALDWLARRGRSRALFLYFGSSVGNYEPDEAQRLLGRVAGALGEGDALLLGVDLDKDPRVLEAAYNDVAGATARFNLNLLARLNHELGGHFDLDGFEHHAFYDGGMRRVEMHLVSRREQEVPLDALGARVRFGRWESIHTEDSHKYGLEDVAAMAGRAGLTLSRSWLDERRYFSVNRLERA